jgi:enamine deaminase RidA (YjgF/YER057c/UK114 family)
MLAERDMVDRDKLTQGEVSIVKVYNPVNLSKLWVAASHGVETNGFVFVSGQIAYDRDNNLIGLGDVAAQTRQVWSNIADVLKDAGSSVSDVVSITAYLTRWEDYDAYNQASLEALGDTRPARTTVGVSLYKPDFLVEITVIAVKGVGSNWPSPAPSPAPYPK